MRILDVVGKSLKQSLKQNTVIGFGPPKLHQE